MTAQRSTPEPSKPTCGNPLEARVRETAAARFHASTTLPSARKRADNKADYEALKRCDDFTAAFLVQASCCGSFRSIVAAQGFRRKAQCCVEAGENLSRDKVFPTATTLNLAPKTLLRGDDEQTILSSWLEPRRAAEVKSSQRLRAS